MLYPKVNSKYQPKNNSVYRTLLSEVTGSKEKEMSPLSHSQEMLSHRGQSFPSWFLWSCLSFWVVFSYYFSSYIYLVSVLLLFYVFILLELLIGTFFFHMEYKEVTFKNLCMSENVFVLTSLLTGSWAGYRFPISNISLRTLKELLLRRMPSF